MMRQLNIDDLDKLAYGAEQFYRSSEFLECFDMETFKRSWSRFLGLNMGVIFGLVDEKTGEIYGALGGVKYTDPHNGQLKAAEMFWYVVEERRGEGMKLLAAFEKWAKEEGCKYIHMVHLADLMPDAIRRVYERRGYKLAEMAYRKEVR